MNHSTQFASQMRRRYCAVGETKTARALSLFLVALSSTAMWGLILYFAARWLGAPIEPVGLGVTLLGIFVLLLLVLGMTTLSSDADRAMGLTDPPPLPLSDASDLGSNDFIAGKLFAAQARKPPQAIGP